MVAMTQMIGKATVVNLRIPLPFVHHYGFVDMVPRAPLTIDSTENDIIDTCTCQEA